jgi:hypothetical protein
MVPFVLIYTFSELETQLQQSLVENSTLLNQPTAKDVQHHQNEVPPLISLGYRLGFDDVQI